MTVTPGTNSWISVEDANLYFADRLSSGDYWNTNTLKSAALITAYKFLVNSGLWSFPSVATQLMKDAQCEMALFLLIHLADMDRRKGLQVQGVIAANLVGETYDKSMLSELPVPPIVSRLLSDCSDETVFGAEDVTRDETI
jgi:hypothetical protein